MSTHHQMDYSFNLEGGVNHFERWGKAPNLSTGNIDRLLANINAKYAYKWLPTTRTHYKIESIMGYSYIGDILKEYLNAPVNPEPEPFQDNYSLHLGINLIVEHYFSPSLSITGIGEWNSQLTDSDLNGEKKYAYSRDEKLVDSNLYLTAKLNYYLF